MEAEDRIPADESTVAVKSLSGLLEMPPLGGAISTSMSPKANGERVTAAVQEENVKPEASQAVIALLKLGLSSSLRPQQPIYELNNEPCAIVKKRSFEMSDDEASSISAEPHKDGPGECWPEQSSLIGKSCEKQIGESIPVKEEIGVPKPQVESRAMESNSGQLNIGAETASPTEEAGSRLSQPAKKKKRTKDQTGKDSGSVRSDWGVPKAYIRRTMKMITSDNMLLSRDVPPLVANATEKFLSWFISSCADELKQKESDEKTHRVGYGDVSDMISNGGGKLGFLSFVVPPPLP